MRAVAVPRFRVPAELVEIPEPGAGPGEILVRVEFAGINPFDWKISDGIFEGRRPHVFPLVLGVDGAGTVDAVGSGVTRFQTGDRVLGQFLHDPVGTGTYVEVTPVPEALGVVRLPPSLTFPEASALPTSGMTALEGLDVLALPSDSSLVIVGASGGVGSFATELAASRGIRVTAVARARSAARLRSLGAAEVIDPTSEDAPSSLARSHPRGVDGVLDAMSDGPGFARYVALVRRGGVAVTTTFAADAETLATPGIRVVNLNLQPRADLLGRLVKEVVDHGLRVPVEQQVPLPNAPSALSELKAGRGHGKTVVSIRG